MANIQLSSTTPAAPAGNTNVTWQVDANDHVSAYVPSISAFSGTLSGAITFTGAVTLDNVTVPYGAAAYYGGQAASYFKTNNSTWNEFRFYDLQAPTLPSADTFVLEYNTRSTSGGTDVWDNVFSVASQTGAITFNTSPTFNTSSLIVNLAPGDFTGVTLGNAAASNLPRIQFRASDGSPRFGFQVNGINTPTERISIYGGPLNQAGTVEALSVYGTGMVCHQLHSENSFYIPNADAVGGYTKQFTFTNFVGTVNVYARRVGDNAVGLLYRAAIEFDEDAYAGANYAPKFAFLSVDENANAQPYCKIYLFNSSPSNNTSTMTVACGQAGNSYEFYVVFDGDFDTPTVSYTTAAPPGVLQTPARLFTETNMTFNVPMSISSLLVDPNLTVQAVSGFNRAQFAAATGGVGGILLSANSTGWVIDNRGAADTPNNRLAILDPTNTERFTILDGGNIGISQTNPGFLFEVGAGLFSVASSGVVGGHFGQWQTWTPSFSCSGSMTISAETVLDAQYITVGPFTYFKLYVNPFTLGGTPSQNVLVSLPVPVVGSQCAVTMNVGQTGGGLYPSIGDVSGSTLTAFVPGQGNWALGSSQIFAEGFYRSTY